MISNDNLNIEALNGLTPEERALALEILKQYSQEGRSDILEDLTYGDFAEIPVGIETFLDDDRYLGQGIWERDSITGERRCTLFPYWRETLKKIFPDNLTTAYNTLILTGSIGLGKAQPLDALVLTKDGYKQMRELTLQDKVYGNDGKLHDILGIFPQGKKNICKITFSDHTSTECCDEHLWTVFNIDAQKWETLELKQLIEKGIYRKTKIKSHNYKIPITNPIEFNSSNITIDPYILGVLIGDGSLTNCTQFASNDSEIIENIRNNLIEGYEVHQLSSPYSYSICKSKNTHSYDLKKQIPVATPNWYTEQLKKYNLNVKSDKKYIPQEYLYSSVTNRVALLQGLMDTDGYIDKTGSIIEFTTISEKLRDDFVFLVQSLGGVCHVRAKKTSYFNKKYQRKVEGQLSYNIGIKLPKNICPFRLQRKIDRLNSKALDPFRYITAIEYIEEKDCQCIYINSKEHLYLTNDFIVTHNTLMAVLCQLYLLYRMLCLKDPYSYYKMMPSDKITFSMLNITLDTAQGVGWDKLQQLIQGSPWFLEHGEMNASRTNPQWQPNNHIELIFGSNNRHIVGRALFCNFTDEVNFGIGGDIEKKKAKQKKMIAQIDARMKSRFMKGIYLPTLNIIASSKDTEQAFLDSYINIKKQNESKTTLIIDEPQWVVRNDKGSPEDPGSFYIAVGNKFLAHELLPPGLPEEEVDRYREKGYSLIKVPPGFREDFETNLDQSLMDIAGISTSSNTKYISGIRVNQAKTDEYRNPFTKDIIEVGNSPDDHLQYANFFDLSAVSPMDMSRPLFIHLDMSLSGDKTGIAGVWITGKRPTQADNVDSSRELQYKLAFSVSIKAPKGYQVSFEKNRNFIRWLRDRGFAIKGISSDTYQSAQIQQDLKSDGFKTEIISVDRIDPNSKICIPYHYLKSAIYERRVKIYQKCNLLTDELVGLERLSNGKIDHTSDGINSKDQSDAFCGALYLASKFAEEYSYNYGDNLTAGLDVSLEMPDTYLKTQMIAEFQNELMKSYAEIYQELEYTDQEVRRKQREEYQRYQDIADGIIVI